MPGLLASEKIGGSPSGACGIGVGSLYALENAFVDELVSIVAREGAETNFPLKSPFMSEAPSK